MHQPVKPIDLARVDANAALAPRAALEIFDRDVLTAQDEFAAIGLSQPSVKLARRNSQSLGGFTHVT